MNSIKIDAFNILKSKTQNIQTIRKNLNLFIK